MKDTIVPFEPFDPIDPFEPFVEVSEEAIEGIVESGMEDLVEEGIEDFLGDVLGGGLIVGVGVKKALTQTLALGKNDFEQLAGYYLEYKNNIRRSPNSAEIEALKNIAEIVESVGSVEAVWQILCLGTMGISGGLVSVKSANYLTNNKIRGTVLGTLDQIGRAAYDFMHDFFDWSEDLMNSSNSDPVTQAAEQLTGLAATLVGGTIALPSYLLSKTPGAVIEYLLKDSSNREKVVHRIGEFAANRGFGHETARKNTYAKAMKIASETHYTNYCKDEVRTLVNYATYLESFGKESWSKTEKKLYDWVRKEIVPIKEHLIKKAKDHCS